MPTVHYYVRDFKKLLMEAQQKQTWVELDQHLMNFVPSLSRYKKVKILNNGTILALFIGNFRFLYCSQRNE